MIIAKQYWNKVVDDPTAPFGTRVLPEYEIHSQWKCGEDKYFPELKARKRNNPRFTIHRNKIVEDCGRQYGIHSYIEITIE